MLKNKNIFDLDPERLASTDEFGNRVYIHPEDVKGPWKDRRTFVYWSLILLYLLLPWFNINGRPALMIDIFKREFTFLGLTLHGVEPILFFLMVACGLFFVGFATSLFGRVWCGWACPQTVFIQTIFLKIESLVEGKSKARRDLDKAPWGLPKIWKRCLKWVLFLLVSLHIAHTFIGYFVGPWNLLQITLHSPTQNWGFFSATMIMTSIFLLDFGWFREQFCILACPYGRMQSVLMDENSLVVAYDGARGDCINCYHCVKVCPTGIDIRRGTQLECIACTQCIDACDNIMDKVNRPRGLIRYSSENELSGKKRKVLTLRSAVYAVISIGLLSLFFYFLSASTNLSMVFLRSKVPFQVLDGGKIVVNHFTLKLSHQGSKTPMIDFKLDHPSVQFITNVRPVVVDMPEKKIIVFFKFGVDLLESGSSQKIKVSAFDVVRNEVISTQEVTLVGPSN